MRGFTAILLKEVTHIRRERTTLLFAFLIPVLQLSIFGYAIDMKIEHISTVVQNLDGREQSRRLIEAFANTRILRITGSAMSDEEFERAMSSGRAKVGIRIPPDYSERRLRGEQAEVQVLIDGSNSNVATAALSAVNQVGLNLSVREILAAEDRRASPTARGETGIRAALPVEVRGRMLYNPDLLSARFFVPALVGIILQNVTIFLTSFSIVRERENGTLEQLFVTPVSRTGLMFGKLVPYTIMGFIETLIILVVMVFVFQVPIQGNLVLLLALTLLFLFAALGLGLLISTFAQTQLQAIQVAFVILMPSILLSGFVFPRETIPPLIAWISYLIPVTYFLEILRGIILRAADLRDLIPHILGLAACCAVILTLSILRFQKQLG